MDLLNPAVVFGLSVVFFKLFIEFGFREVWCSILSKVDFIRFKHSEDFVITVLDKRCSQQIHNNCKRGSYKAVFVSDTVALQEAAFF